MTVVIFDQQAFAVVSRRAVESRTGPRGIIFTSPLLRILTLTYPRVKVDKNVKKICFIRQINICLRIRMHSLHFNFRFLIIRMPPLNLLN